MSDGLQPSLAPDVDEPYVVVRGGAFYIILSSYVPTNLAKAVDSLIYGRWKPLGGICAVYEVEGEATEYLQAMEYAGE